VRLFYENALARIPKYGHKMRSSDFVVCRSTRKSQERRKCR